MATPLEITYRKAGVEYHEEHLSDMGGWNADATDATLGRDEFTEIRNFRRPTTGDFQVRSGAVTYPLVGTTGATVLAKCEYRNDYNGSDTFFDVTLCYNAGAVGLTILDSVSGYQTSIAVKTIGAIAESWVVQYAWSLIVTIKGTGSFEVAPVYTTNLGQWTVTSLGKDVCPTPSTIDFVARTTGDLFVIDNNASDPPNTTNTPSFTNYIKIDPSDPPNPLLIPLPLDTDYWLNAIGEFDATNRPRYWVYGSPDVNNADIPQDHVARLHTMSRAWGYRFVAVQEFVNSKGDKYRIRSAPSVDIWIPDVTYGPAQWGPQPTGYVGTLLANAASSLTNSNIHSKWICISCSPFTGSNALDTNGHLIGTLAFPTAQAMQDLQGKFTRLTGLSGSNGPSAPYTYLGSYLGFDYENFGILYGGTAPYLVDVPASLLKKAPMTIFDFAQFHIAGLQGTVVEIEVYRTAHSEPQDKDNTKKDPNFEAHKYGYVGSVLPGETLADEVVDDAIDFGTTPDQQDGYLRGQFSGSVMREFDNRLVIGDVITDYRVLPPAEVSGAAGNQIAGDVHVYNSIGGTIYAFWYKVDNQSPSTFYSNSDAFNNHIGGNNTRFFAAYQDINGTISSPVEIALDTTAQPFFPTNLFVQFVCPRGYSAIIDSVILYRAHWNGTSYDYSQMATVKCANGYYTSKNDESNNLGFGQNPLTDLPQGETKRSTAPGSIIFSEPNQIYFWPPLNFESHHQFAPVQGLEVVLGPLYVMTDQSISLTQLDGHREELTKHIGPISRFAIQKVDKVVFFLSPYGMYYVESSGVVQYAAQVQTAILPYLNERLAGVLSLANVRRASLGFIGERNELWLHVPSSLALSTAAPTFGLPHRTIVFKLGQGNDPRHTINYEFDLREDFERGDVPLLSSGPISSGPSDDITKWHTEQVIFNSKAMGGLNVGFYDKQAGAIVTVDCDTPTTWTGSASMEKSWHMGIPSTKKALREIVIRTEGSATLTLMTGQPVDAVSHAMGRVNPGVRRFKVLDPLPPLRHIVAGQSIESVASAPIIRIWSTMDTNSRHDLHIKAIDLFAVILNNHP